MGNSNKEIFMGEVVERIKSRRKELRLSYQSLADLTGLSKSTLQRYETGFIQSINLDNLPKIAEALQTTVDFLLYGEREKDIRNNRIEIRGFDKENGTIEKITISLDEPSSGVNIVYEIEDVLVRIEEDHSLSIHARLLEL